MWALVLTLVGALATLAGAVWLLVGFRATDARFTDDGMLYPGGQTSQVVPNLLRAQGRVGVLVAAGAAVQLVGAVLALVAFSVDK